MPRMAEFPHHLTLDDYAAVEPFAPDVQELRVEAALVRRQLRDRTIWMVSPDEPGSPIPELVASNVSLLRGLGLTVEWLVMGTEQRDFFPLASRLNRLMQGDGASTLTAEDRTLFEHVSRENVQWMRSRIRAEDFVIAHDVQTLGIGAMLREAVGMHAIWWCLGGLDEHTPETRAAWQFLKPYASAYDRSVFIAAEYIPAFLTGRAGVITPALDPLNHKNRFLSVHNLSGILRNAAVAPEDAPCITPHFAEPVRRLHADGSWRPANEADDIGLLHRPIVTQIASWQRLKGFGPLLRGFADLKSGHAGEPAVDDRYRRTLRAARLVLAGPTPAAGLEHGDDSEVLHEIGEAYAELPAELQHDIAILTLPPRPTKCAALTINALQRCSSVVVRNSLRESFGLGVTEAMWKRIPVLVSHAFGLRLQVRDGLDGRVISDPEDPHEIARTLGEMLADPHACEAWGRSAKRRVRDEFLVFAHLHRWLATIVEETPVQVREESRRTEPPRSPPDNELPGSPYARRIGLNRESL